MKVKRDENRLAANGTMVFIYLEFVLKTHEVSRILQHSSDTEMDVDIDI